MLVLLCFSAVLGSVRIVVPSWYHSAENHRKKKTGQESRQPEGNGPHHSLQEAGTEGGIKSQFQANSTARLHCSYAWPVYVHTRKRHYNLDVNGFHSWREG